MLDARSDTPSLDRRSPEALLALRLSIEFVLDVGRVSRGDGDLLDPLILTAILEANQAVIRHDPRLAELYGQPQTALPDDLRRPISINALAKSLRLPFENVRRRVRVWVDEGLCVQLPDGVYVPHAVVTSPSYRAVQAARVERLQLFEGELEDAGLLTPAAPEARVFPSLARAADRALAGYMLRTCDRVMALAQTPLNGFVLLGLCSLNAERLSRSRPVFLDEVESYARPCTTAALARRVDAPDETVRRRLAALGERGLARRQGAGWVAAAPASLVEELDGLVADNIRDLRRLFAQVRAFGRGEAAPDAGSHEP
jgi:DNA-binding Lrp family transcriptional regulator